METPKKFQIKRTDAQMKKLQERSLLWTPLVLREETPKVATRRGQVSATNQKAKGTCWSVTINNPSQVKSAVMCPAGR